MYQSKHANKERIHLTWIKFMRQCCGQWTPMQIYRADRSAETTVEWSNRTSATNFTPFRCFLFLGCCPDTYFFIQDALILDVLSILTQAFGRLLAPSGGGGKRDGKCFRWEGTQRGVRHWNWPQKQRTIFHKNTQLKKKKKKRKKQNKTKNKIKRNKFSNRGRCPKTDPAAAILNPSSGALCPSLNENFQFEFQKSAMGSKHRPQSKPLMSFFFFFFKFYFKFQ